MEEAIQLERKAGERVFQNEYLRRSVLELVDRGTLVQMLRLGKDFLPSVVEALYEEAHVTEIVHFDKVSVSWNLD